MEATLLLAASAAAVLIGAGLAIAPSLPGSLLFAAGLAALPLTLLVVLDRPALALGAFVALQPLEHFEVQTPVGTVSPGIGILVLLAVFYAGGVGKADAPRGVRTLTVLLLLYVAVLVTRVTYQPVGEVVREMITTSSFVAVAIVGMALARAPNVVRSVAVGATIALLTLGILGVMVQLGIIPPPQRFQPAYDPRSLIPGLQSPITRNYGLDVPFDAVSLLVPLCAPYLFLRVISGPRDVRALLSATAFAALAATIIFVFQGRGMLVQLALVSAIGLWFVRPILGAAVLAVFVVLLAQSLLAVDEISSQTRVAHWTFVAEDLLRSPQSYVLGQDEGQVYHEALRSRPITDLTQALRRAVEGIHIHNFFLSNLVAGGILSFALIVSVYFLAARHAVRLWRARANSFHVRVLVTAFFSALVPLMIEPVGANIVGSWLILGLVAGTPIAPRRRGPPSASAPPDAVRLPQGRVRRSPAATGTRTGVSIIQRVQAPRTQRTTE